jgi:hypothetical protein
LNIPSDDNRLKLTLDKGNRVQWFRAEAEMERWREENETRLADLLRCIRPFKRMHEVWLELSRSGPSNSSPSARTSSEMYKKLMSGAEADLKAVLPEGISLAKGEILVDYVQRMRDREDAACKFGSIKRSDSHSLYI